MICPCKTEFLMERVGIATTIMDEERYHNYLFLQRSLSELRSGRKPTDDWEQHHYNFFTKIRNFFPSFDEMNIDIIDEEFRNKAYETEKMARYLENYFERAGTVDYKLYTLFLERIQYLFEYFMDEEELCSLLGQTGM